VSLVSASIVIGTGLGILTAVTLTLQFNLFTEMPFQLDFPVALFLLVTLFSFVLAVFGSYYPSRAFTSKPIAIVLRGGGK
jgi:ABC-type antimicrobial peptide transport system permease subunit